MTKQILTTEQKEILELCNWVLEKFSDQKIVNRTLEILARNNITREQPELKKSTSRKIDKGLDFA